MHLLNESAGDLVMDIIKQSELGRPISSPDN